MANIQGELAHKYSNSRCTTKLTPILQWKAMSAIARQPMP